MNKREFIRLGGILAGGTLLGRAATGCRPQSIAALKSKGSLKLRFKPYTLQLKHAFTLASSSRTTTPVMLTEIEYEGITGYGEASMPPYLGESHDTVSGFLSGLDLSQFNDPLKIEDILDYTDRHMPGNYAAKASVDIALHDLAGKLLDKPLYMILGLNPDNTPDTSFTIGLDTPEIVRQKVAEAEPYNVLKVKLGRDNDREMIEVIRSCTGKPLCVDVNQGWKDREKALEMIQWLSGKNVLFVEQPMPKEQADDISWLTSRSPLPVIGDEAIQNMSDLVRYRDIYSGINVKLMKCGGIRAAFTMLRAAKSLGMKTMLGCMTETSCAVSAAAHLSPLAGWCDLDGNLLISNDTFEGMKIIRGKVTLTGKPGIGIDLR